MTASRKNIIYRSAARLFRQKGYGGSSLRELAALAGIQGGSVYHHFPSKQAILYQIMEETMTSLIEQVEQEVMQADHTLDRLQRAVAFHIRHHIEERDETFVTDAEMRSLEPDNYQKIEGLRNRYERIFRDLLVAGVAEGSLRVADPALAARALLQMCTGVSYWYSPSGSYTIDTIARQYVDLFFWGICGGRQAEKHDA